LALEFGLYLDFVDELSLDSAVELVLELFVLMVYFPRDVDLHSNHDDLFELFRRDVFYFDYDRFGHDDNLCCIMEAMVLYVRVELVLAYEES
jgi:hypothetical protein